MQLPVSRSAFGRKCTREVLQWDDCKESSRVPFVVLYPQIGSKGITDDAFSYGRIWGGTRKVHLHLDRSKASELQAEAGHAGCRGGGPKRSKMSRLSLNITDPPFLLPRCPYWWQLAFVYLLNQSTSANPPFNSQIPHISSTRITSLWYLSSTIIFQSHFTVRFPPNN